MPEKPYKTVDDLIEAERNGELPPKVRAVDMRNAAFAVIVNMEGEITAQLKVSDADFVRHLRELADKWEKRYVLPQTN